MKRLLACLLAATLCACTGNPGPTAGTGSKAGNAMNGTVRYSPDIVRWGPGDSLDMSTARLDLYTVTSIPATGYNWTLDRSLGADRNGTYCFEHLNTGYYALVAEKGGFKAFSGYLYTVSPDLRLDTLYLNATQRITGTISDSAGNPARDVILGLIGTPYFDTVRVYDAGVFAFAAVPQGDYKMEIRALALKNALIDTTAPPDTISLVDTLAVNPDAVFFTVGNITCAASKGNALNTPDTTFISDYASLPPNNNPQVDTVTVRNSTVGVLSRNYSIIYTVK